MALPKQYPCPVLQPSANKVSLRIDLDASGHRVEPELSASEKEWRAPALTRPRLAAVVSRQPFDERTVDLEMSMGKRCR